MRVLVVAQTDVVSLWSAGRIHTFLEEGTGRDRLRMVLNRYKKIPGFTDEDVQQVTNCKVLWKVPNAYQAVSPSIDHGTPVVLQDGSKSAARTAHWPKHWQKPHRIPTATQISFMARKAPARKPPAA